MTNGDVKINVIKRQNKVAMETVAEVAKLATTRVARLGEVQEARQMHKNRMETIRELGKLRDAHMHYVAQIDNSIWAMILDVFARVDENTGELIDDGLLYKWDVDKGCHVLNRDFFYALISMLEAQGYQCDMRGKNQLMV